MTGDSGLNVTERSADRDRGLHRLGAVGDYLNRLVTIRQAPPRVTRDSGIVIDDSGILTGDSGV